MNGRLLILVLASMVGLMGVAGCRSCCRRATIASAPPPCCDAGPPGRFRPLHALTPRRVDPLPGPVPPVRTDLLPPASATMPGLPPPEPPDTRGYGPPPPAEPSWRPSPDAVRTPEPPRDSARLFPPESAEPPQSPPRKETPSAPPTRPEPVPQARPPSPPLPVGIPQFAMVRNRVASGLKPALEGGLDWLQENGYRTVLHIRRPGEDDSADRRQVEKRGMKYHSIEVSTQTLTREVVDQFNHLIGEVSCLPLFVYDRDGILQGALWYLHFRIVDLDTDETARVRAGRLGLKEDGSAEQREMWLAIQKYLSSR